MRVGPWKAHFITQGCYGIGPAKEVHEVPRLYHLDTDPSEKYDLAELHPDVVRRLQEAARKHQDTMEPFEDQLVERITPQ